MEHVSVEEARLRLDALVERAGETGERIIVTRDGRPVAAIVHFEDAEYLQGKEDRFDREAADAALAEVAREGTVPWEEVEARLDAQRVSHALSG